MADLSHLLSPLDRPNASGAELRDDFRFHAVERLVEPATRDARLAAAKNGTQVQIDWAGVLEAAGELAATGRDLRLLTIVARALFGTEGAEGLAEALDLLTQTVTTYWDTLHPGLREAASRREAATRRINALFQIENSENGLLSDLEFGVLMSPRVIGPVTGGDLAKASLLWNTVMAEGPGGMSAKEQTEAAAAHEARVSRVGAACRGMATERPDDYAALTDNIAAAQRHLAALEAALDAHVAENGVGVRFSKLNTFLTRIQATLQANQLANSAPGAAPQVTDAPVTEGHMNGAADPRPAPQAAGAIPGRINSRDDVGRCLDLIIDFYERTEPSSPIPHLARRMRKMVPMNFLQLMEEIAPSGMKEFKSIAGVFDDKPK